MKFVVFDIDGVLLKDSIGVDFINWLHARGLFPDKETEVISQAVYKQLKGKISYSKRGELIITSWAAGLRGKEGKEIYTLAEKFIGEYKKIYPSSVDLINYFKKHGFYIIVISRAFQEVLIALNSKLRFDYIIGTQFELSQGKYTGKLKNKMWQESVKMRLLLKIIRDKNLEMDSSFAFGDSEQDVFMLELVDHPICLYPSEELVQIARDRGWVYFNSIKKVLKALREGKIVGIYSWYEHYSKKYRKLIMDQKMFEGVLKNDQPYLKVVKKYVPENGKILEAGCGLARTVINMSLLGYKITAIDNDAKLLGVAKINAKKFGRNITFKKMNFFNLRKEFRKNAFNAITHQGVLEHFSSDTIKRILDMQLDIVPIIIFSVPIKSRHNDKYFKSDKIGHRNLWSIKKWKELLREYKIREFLKTRQRTDNLIVVLQRRRKRIK